MSDELSRILQYIHIIESSITEIDCPQSIPLFADLDIRNDIVFFVEGGMASEGIYFDWSDFSFRLGWPDAGYVQGLCFNFSWFTGYTYIAL